MRRRLLAFATTAILTASTLDGNAMTHCTIVDSPGVSFGRYDVFSPVPLDAAGSFSYECHGVTQDDLIVIELSAGSGSGHGTREMSNGATRLAYNLYLDAARTTVWGNGTGGSSVHGPIRPNSGTNTLWVYGRIPARQNVSVGAYSDTLTMTIVY